MAKSYQFASYSLADYLITLTVNSVELRNNLGLSTDSFTVGGEGQFMGSITVSYAVDQWTTDADATGAWVHSKSFDQHGTIALSINQMSDAVVRFIGIVSAYYSSNNINDGFTLSVQKAGNTGTFAISAEDCRIQKIPDQAFGDEAAEQTWTFTCGRILANVPVGM